MRASRASELLDRLLAGVGERESWGRAAGGRGAAGAWGEVGAWKATRPSLPPLLFLAASMWAATALGIDALFGGTRDDCLHLAAVGAVAAVVGLVLLAFRNALGASIVLGVALGLLLASAQAFSLMEQHDALLEVKGAQRVEVTRDARPNDYGATAHARAANGALVRISVSRDDELLVGQVLEFSGGWREPSVKSARDSWHLGIVATASVKSFELVGQTGPLALLREVRSWALGAIEDERQMLETMFGWDFDEPARFLRAVLFGNGGGIYGTAFYQAVKVDGLAHLVAVSGAHLVIVCGLVSVAMRRLPIPRALGVGLQVLIIGCYLVLTGAPVSAVRAAVMASLALLSFFSARRPYALGGLSACVIAMLALNPTAAFSISFLLSATATLGIVLFAGFFGEWITRPWGLRRNAAIDSVALTLASSVATVPLSAMLFGQVSLISPLANVIAAPVFTVLCVGGLAAVALLGLVPALGGVALAGLFLLGSAFCLVLEVIACIPLASVPAALDEVPAFIAAAVPFVLLWLFWPCPARKGWGAIGCALVAVVIAFSVAPWLHGDEVVMLDVGQGDAFLVRSGPHAVLIDTGTDDVALLEGLGAQGIRSLDAVVVTHPDDDHCGSLPAMKGVVGIGCVVVARDLLDNGSANCAKLRATASVLVGSERIVGLQVGDVLQCGNLRLQVVGPDSFADDGGNADSLVLMMEADDNGDGAVDHTALFCGDAEAEQLHGYERAGRLHRVDLYKVGHHGSRASIDDELARVLRPQVALVSAGENNRYGHPTPEALDTLERAGSVVFRTDRQGCVVCLLSADRLEVRTER